MLTRAINVIIGVFVFAGFTLINYLSSPAATSLVSATVNQFFQSTQYLWYCVIIASYVIQQTLRDMPRPASMAEVQELEPIIEQFLDIAIKDYYQFLVGKNRTLVPVRINLMLKVRRYPLEFPKLKIVFEYCCNPKAGPSGVVNVENLPLSKACYSLDEKSILWEKGDGTCGQAYGTGQVTYYDSNDPTLKGPQGKLKDSQKKVLPDVNSVISLPVRLHGKVIAVMNLDSSQSIGQTCFNDLTVIRMMEGKANFLAKVSAIFADGLRVAA